ncbi:MAG: exodeoxyribonuclease VII large subunit [Erysipelotrichaceae bacterium]|nr:exodeoxyribonuclease VII large subunit [Erysipelotrichaceae bacterium]
MQELTVSSLLRYLKSRLDNDSNIQKITVIGEISNYHRHFSGHLYFTLKDEKAAINCVMFKSAAASLSFEPKNGDKVIVYANTSIFEASGQLQLYILKMDPQGLGDLYARYEALKKKLTQEGKFDQDHKIELEKIYLEKVAVLVGDRSAAMSDIKICFSRRWPLCKVDYYPVLVQGPEAPKDIIAKLKKADDLGYDAIILARGGGSFEDLFCFSDEELVNTIYELKTFIVTGIGHEQDFSLADFAADLRAATPTAAVELITPDIADVLELLEEYEDSLKISLYENFEQRQMEFDFLYKRLSSYQDRFVIIQNRIDSMMTIIEKDIRYMIGNKLNYIDQSVSDMSYKLDYRLNEARLSFKRLNTLLEAYSCENVLKRGYTMVLQNDRVIKNSVDLKNDEFEVKFHDGTIKAIKR